MLYPKIEYSLTTKPLDNLTMLQVENFLNENETIFKVFDGIDIVAIFTDKKIIFVRIPPNPMAQSIRYEVEVLPYASICHYSVLRLSDKQHGKLELKFLDEGLTFYLPEYCDAIDLSKKIEQFIL